MEKYVYIDNMIDKLYDPTLEIYDKNYYKKFFKLRKFFLIKAIEKWFSMNLEYQKTKTRPEIDVIIRNIINENNSINLLSIIILMENDKKQLIEYSLPISSIIVEQFLSIKINSDNLIECEETQNIIYHTYKYHIQRYPLFFDKEVIVDLNDKNIITVTKNQLLKI